MQQKTSSGRFMRLGSLCCQLCISALAFLLSSKYFFHGDTVSSCLMCFFSIATPACRGTFCLVPVPGEIW